MTLLLPLLLAPLQGGMTLPPARERRPVPVRSSGPNLVVIVADDLGVDLVGAYAEGADPPCTPQVDALAAQGMLFRNAWSSPLCSPTRATLLTGRYGFRTGIGTIVANDESGLALDELTLPEALDGYATTCVGKWHLAGNLGPDHPNQSGFDHFAGILAGAVPSYTQWVELVDGTPAPTTEYATTRIADRAIAALQSMPEPWLLVASFNAPHVPYHEPPASVCDAPACPETWCGALPANPTNLELGKAMIEALDAEVGRLLAEVDARDPDAWVVFVGDNGSARDLCEPPFAALHAKGTLYEGGVNVPLLVRGPGVPPSSECAALVSTTDLFGTLTELASRPAASEDSVSFVPCLANPALAVRATVYAELFPDNHAGAPPLAGHERAVRETRYKLIRRDGEPDELYDLDDDPFERTNLLPDLSPQEQDAYDALAAELDALGVG